jgi:hypothetical protein
VTTALSPRAQCGSANVSGKQPRAGFTLEQPGKAIAVRSMRAILPALQKTTVLPSHERLK